MQVRSSTPPRRPARTAIETHGALQQPTNIDWGDKTPVVAAVSSQEQGPVVTSSRWGEVVRSLPMKPSTPSATGGSLSDMASLVTSATFVGPTPEGDRGAGLTSQDRHVTRGSVVRIVRAELAKNEAAFLVETPPNVEQNEDLICNSTHSEASVSASLAPADFWQHHHQFALARAARAREIEGIPVREMPPENWDAGSFSRGASSRPPVPAPPVPRASPAATLGAGTHSQQQQQQRPPLQQFAGYPENLDVVRIEETPPSRFRGTSNSDWNSTYAGLDGRVSSVSGARGLRRSASGGNLRGNSDEVGNISRSFRDEAWTQPLQDDTVAGLSNFVEALNWRMHEHGRQILRIRGELRSRARIAECQRAVAGN